MDNGLAVRFLILTQYFPPEIGAPQIRLAALVRSLQQAGHQVEIVTAFPHHLVGKIFPAYRRKFYLKEDFEGRPLHRTWVYAASGTGVARLLNYLSFALSSFVGLARAQRPDYIFVESPPLFLGITGAIFSYVRKVPMVFNVADLWPDSVRELGVLKNAFLIAMAERLERWIYRRSRFVNAITPGIKQVLIAKKHLPTLKVLFLPNGVDLTRFAPRERDVALAQQLHLEGLKTFIYAGTHGVAQGLQTLIDAAVLCAGDGVSFLFIGDGPVKEELVQNARDRNLKNVVFLGMQPAEEMPKFFSLASASIVPLIKAELFRTARPSKIITSLACGVPVIFCGEGETADLLTESRAGIVVPPQNAAALASAVEKLAGDQTLRFDLSRNGLKLAGDFGWDPIVSRWLNELSTAEVGSTG